MGWRIFFRTGAWVLLGVLGGCTEKPEIFSPKFSQNPPDREVSAVTLAVYPLYNPQKLFSVYQPLVDGINKKFPKLNLRLQASRDYGEFEEKIRTKKIEILLPNPWQTLLALDQGYHVGAMSGSREDFKGIFLVRRDSGIQQPRDLIGKAVSYPSPTALAACIMPQFFLYRQGLDVNRDIINKYVGSQDSSIESVYAELTAAGATWPPPWRAYQADHPEKAAQLQVIWETEALINNSLMFRNDFSPDVERELLDYLGTLPQSAQGQAWLARMGIDGFHPAGNRDYEALKPYIAEFEAKVRPVEPKK